MGFREGFWGSSPPKKRIESRGSGWLGNGWDKKALLDSRPKGKLVFCYACLLVRTSIDLKARLETELVGFKDVRH